MISNKLLILPVVATAILAGCTAPAGGRWPREGVASISSANSPLQVRPAEGLLLSAAAERTEYLVGEPIYLSLKLQNTGLQSRRVVGSLDPGDRAASVLVTKPGGQQRTFVPLAVVDSDEGIMMSWHRAP